MSEIEPRRATAADVDAVTALVREAYAKYVPRMGKEPVPMRADYGKALRDHQLWVLEEAGRIIAALEMVPEKDHLQIENVAVSPQHQGRGFGRQMLVFAEAEALRQGFSQTRLYTAQAMAENIEMYKHLGYAETERKTVSDIPRVYMEKSLTGS